MRKSYKSYLWVDPKNGRTFARVQIRQADGRYKTYLKRAESENHAARLANEIFLEIVFKDVQENKISFDEFKQRIVKIYENRR